MSRLLALLLCLCASACTSLSKEYPEKTFYAFDVERGDRQETSADAPLLLVKRFRSGPMNQTLGLIYRTEPSTYEADYYSEFFAAPEGLLTVIVGAWLADAGEYQVVVGAPGEQYPDYVLEGSLRSLYVDLEGDAGPRAVIDMQFFVSRRENGVSAPVWRADFSRAEAADSASGADVLAAWNRGVASMLAELESDLAQSLAGE